MLSAAMGAGVVNVDQARAIVAALGRLPKTGEFAVTAEQRAAAEAHLVAVAAHHDAKDAAVAGQAPVRGDRPRPRREVRGQAARSRRSPGVAAHHVHDVGGRRGHHPRPVPHPLAARADAGEDDPRHHLTGPVRDRRVRCRRLQRQHGIDPDLPTPVRHGIAFTQAIRNGPPPPPPPPKMDRTPF